MSAQVRQAEATAPPPVEYRGRFKKGFDPRRHKFTQEECERGFWNALYAVAERNPDAVRNNPAFLRNFLATMLARKPNRVN